MSISNLSETFESITITVHVNDNLEVETTHFCDRYRMDRSGNVINERVNVRTLDGFLAHELFQEEINMAFEDGYIDSNNKVIIELFGDETKLATANLKFSL